MQRQSSNLSLGPPPLAHVHLHCYADMGLTARSEPHKNKDWTYDDVHRQLLVNADNKLLCWNVRDFHGDDNVTDYSLEDRSGKEHVEEPSSALSPRSPDSKSSPQVCFLSQGPVLSARFSPDKKLLAIQRSKSEIEFVNQEDGSQFWQKCKSKSFGYPDPSLLGFFWVECEKCDLVLVTSAGLELYTLLDSRKGLQLKELKKHSISWYKYTSDTKLIIMAKGSQCNVLSGYQFSHAGLIRLPRFEIDIGFDQSQRGQLDIEDLSPDSIYPIVLYGKLFCCHINSSAQKIVLYRLYKDATVKQYSYPTYSTQMGISVMDNLLLVHHVESGIVMIFDIMTNSMQPFVSPLPMRLHGLQESESIYEAESTPDDTDAISAQKYKFNFCASNFAFDMQNGLLLALELDLDAIALSCPNTLHTISFLHRRDSEIYRKDPKSLILLTVKTMVQEHESLSYLKQAFEIICFVISSSKGSTKGGSKPQSGPANSKNGVNLVSFCKYVFEKLDEDQVVETAFLMAAMETFYLCASSFQLKLPSTFFCLMVELLLLNDEKQKLISYLSGHFFEDSKVLAERLERLSEDHSYLSQFALDMLFRLRLYNESCNFLFRRGRILDALRVLKDYHLNSISPVAFLDAAAKTEDQLVFLSVYRFCKEFVPGFTGMDEKYMALIKGHTCT